MRFLLLLHRNEERLCGLNSMTRQDLLKKNLVDHQWAMSLFDGISKVVFFLMHLSVTESRVVIENPKSIRKLTLVESCIGTTEQPMCSWESGYKKNFHMSGL